LKLWKENEELIKKVLSLTGVDLITEDSFREIDLKETGRIALALLNNPINLLGDDLGTDLLRQQREVEKLGYDGLSGQEISKENK
jgi:hypothetical protein